MAIFKCLAVSCEFRMNDTKEGIEANYAYLFLPLLRKLPSLPPPRPFPTCSHFSKADEQTRLGKALMGQLMEICISFLRGVHGKIRIKFQF